MMRSTHVLAAGLSVTLLLAGSSPVEAHKHALGGHADHLWTEDLAAYRSYRESKPVAKRSSGPLEFVPIDGVETIDAAYLEDSLRTLAGEKDDAMKDRGSDAGRAAARAFMKAEFESLGFAVHEENYGRGTNLVAERAGKSGKILVVSAHFDSVNNPGADDDGTGVAAMLATAKLIGSRELENGVRFVAFDQEELGLVGSAAYVKALVGRGEQASILGDLHMEMMGYNSKKDGKFHVISCDRADSKFLADAYDDVVAKMSGLVITKACTDRSDHSSFWNAGIAAVVISENFFGGDSNPCYHRSCDKTDLVDFGYFTKVAEAGANVVLQIATNAAPAPVPNGSSGKSGSSWPSLDRR